jgi:5-methylcytosine-specific restriction endonuclease McrA
MKRRDLIKQCADCGYCEVPEILVIHHIDRNHKNNLLENLKVLCPNCHAIEHYVENTKGWKHRSTRFHGRIKDNSNALDSA